MKSSTSSSINQKSEPVPSATKPRSREWMIWAIVIAVSAILLWPTIKEKALDIAGIEPPESKIAWKETLAAAMDESKSAGKPILAVFSASWCPPCKMMKRDVWPDEKVTAAVESKFVAVHLDVDESDGRQASEKYQVDSIPRILVLDAKGNVLASASTMTRDGTLAFLDKAARAK